MSPQLYEVLSLSARYLFALLAVLMVFRALVWILADRRETQKTLHRLPNAGYVGELIVVAGDRGLDPGLAIPVPWEGILGSVRSCDLWVPAAGVRRNHLFFSFQPGQGLLIHPFSGCEALVNNRLLTVRSAPEKTPVTNGSFLQIGNAVLRFCAFAGLAPDTGFDPVHSSADVLGPRPVPDTAVSGPVSAIRYESVPPAQYPSDPCPPDGVYPLPYGMTAETPAASDASAAPEVSGPSSVSPVRRRRRDRWEVDWSE